MRSRRAHRALAVVFGASIVAVASCGDDETLENYNPQPVVEKVNCAGGVKCAECCNDKECKTGQFCQDGANDPGRVILFCDGPEDCVNQTKCCMSQTNGGAIISRCEQPSQCSGVVLCHGPDHCGGSACANYEGAEWVGICDSGAEG